MCQKWNVNWYNINSNEQLKLKITVLKFLLDGLIYLQSFENHLYVAISQISNSTSDLSSKI